MGKNCEDKGGPLQIFKERGEKGDVAERGGLYLSISTPECPAKKKPEGTTSATYRVHQVRTNAPTERCIQIGSQTGTDIERQMRHSTVCERKCQKGGTVGGHQGGEELLTGRQKKKRREGKRTRGKTVSVKAGAIGSDERGSEPDAG